MLQKGFDQFAKLSCRWRYGRLLSAYLDHEVDAQVEGVIAGHLHECARCRVEFEQLRFANRALVEFEIPPMRNPQSGGQVFQLPAITAVSARKKLYSQRIAVPVPLAAGVAIALVGATLFAMSRNQQPPIQSTVLLPAPSFTDIKVVEVPVERVVIRTVYSKRPGSRRVREAGKDKQLLLTPPDSKADIARNATRKVEWSDSTLKDFRPAASANLRVVKEHEK
ncbi:MAG: zf-HC2 domain-containing protein [Pyrinomonadaceae bacterium]|nr:zf-HC2 domain-containing protein [Pyrinomonadaceae bacterium]